MGLCLQAIDKHSDTLEFIVSTKRDGKVAHNFFKKNIVNYDLSEKVNVNKSGLQNKYLNNLIEQDHRNIKRLTRPMMEFKF